MPHITDDEFGEITIRRSALSKSMKVSVAPNGTLRISMPKYAPLFMAKRLLASSRIAIRELREASRPVSSYSSGMQIGKSHHLLIHKASTIRVATDGLTIHVSKPIDTEINSLEEKIRPHIINALKNEAKNYLPRRLAHLAKQHGHQYATVRFSHASSRWGSCSSNGTISLNIALMKLPFELIDYVLVHELAHTKQMNHSKEFWQHVQQADPNYLRHRRLLKNESPSI